VETRWTTQVLPMQNRARFLTLLVAIAILSNSLPSVAATLSEAKQLFQSGKYEECVETADAEIQDGTSFEDWYELKIDGEMAVGRYADALGTVEAAKAKFPSSIRLAWKERTIRRYNGQSQKAKEVLADIAALIERGSWRYRDPNSLLIIGNFFLEIGADAKQVRVEMFQRVQQGSPYFSKAFIEAGELALAKSDFGLAAEDLQKALKIDEDDPRILHGLALAYEESDSEKASEYLNQALTLNPRHIPSLLMVANRQLYSERFREASDALDQAIKVNPHHPEAWAMRAVIAHLQSDGEREKYCRNQALEHWKDNPAVDYVIGKLLARNYRFSEAAAAQRKALDFDPDFLPAKMELSNDLLRLGNDEKGWKLAEEVFDADNYNVVAHNLTTLRENMEQFRTLKRDGFVVRMNAQEAEIYGDRVLQILGEAKQTLCQKYNVELNEPIAIEIFDKQQDFAIRTFGLPGGAGFLGVCFGNVITMNSPASQGAAPSNWEAVLWHEFCHVVTLNKTNNKMPRWLSEGISVHEELQQNQAWGQSMNPAYRKMILGEELTPVSKLSGAFIRPASPQHLMFAYYESAVVVDYLVEEFGIEAMRNILDDLGKGLHINDAISRHAAPLEAIDPKFEKYIRDRAQSFGKDADFDREDLPKVADSQSWSEWLKDHPANYYGLQQYALALMREGKWEDAKQPSQKLQKLVPNDPSEASGLRLQAKIAQELGETDLELVALNDIVKLDSDLIDVYQRLIELYQEREQWEEVTLNVERWLAVNPLVPEPYRLLAESGEQTENHEVAIRGLQALAMMDPFDPADIHFRTARLLQLTGDKQQAKRHVLLALEEAPRYRKAYQLLLSLVEPIPTAEDKSTEESSAKDPRDTESKPAKEGEE